MESKTNYTVVGFMVVLLIAALIACSLWLSTTGFELKEYSPYVVYMHEAVSGLNPDSAVKYNGVQVGTVDKIILNKKDPQEVKLLLSIENGTPITTSTSATLVPQGITGIIFVGLSASSPDLTPLKKKPNEPYPVIPSKPSLVNQLEKTLKEVAVNVNSVSRHINRVLDDENTKNFKLILANIQRASGVVAKNIDKVTKNLSEAGENVSSTMKAGKTTFNKLSNEAIPPAVTLLRKLNIIAANIEIVSNQLRQNPSVVIRGTKPQKHGPGE